MTALVEPVTTPHTEATRSNASTSPAAPGPWLVADIGGTNARFGWIRDAQAPLDHLMTLRVAEHGTPALAARAFLSQVAALEGTAYRAPRSAALAVATAVSGDEVAFTNSGWSFSRQALARELALDSLIVLNDFEALALSLPLLGPGELRTIGTLALAGAAPRAALAVIGPGTGLGVAGLVNAGGHWTAVPGEGGHVTLAPADEFEGQLLDAVRRRFDHVSAERLLSGIGLPALHQGMADVLGRHAEPLDARTIVARATVQDPDPGSDDLCARTIDQFCALLGSFAGNVALTLGARGGVFIGGGIVPRLGERFFRSRFRERFEAKGRFQAYLRPIPTALITDTLAALRGARSALERGLS